MAKKSYSGYTKESYNGEAMSNNQKTYSNNNSGQFQQARETLQEVNTYPIVAIPHRYIDKAAADHFGIRSTVSTQDGKTVTASYFPYFNKSGELVAYKKRDWLLNKESSGHFSVVGDLKISCQLFGQQNIDKGGKRLYTTEGEEDAAALFTALIKNLENTKWAGKIIPNVTSIPLGTANASDSFAHNDDFVRSFEEVVLAFDNDSCTPKERLKGVMKGKEATEDVAAYLLTDNIYTIDYPNGLKDSRECLEKGLMLELGKVASFSLQQYSPETIFSGDDVSVDDIMKPLGEGFRINRFQMLMEKLHGFRTHELTTYAAFSGVGKSTLSREIAWEMIRSGKKVGLIFLEEPMIKTQQSLIALELGIPLNVFREDPAAVTTADEVSVAKARVLSNGNVFFLNHFGSLKVSKLMQQIRYLHKICGCEHIFIDHISMVIAGSESNNERKDIDMLYEELASFMTVNEVAIHAVMHLKRVEDKAMNTYEDEGEEEEKPTTHWRKVTKEMLRGSSGAEQMSSQIVMLENEVLPDGRRGRVRIKIEKNREWSHLGICDTLLMDEKGRLQEVPTDPEWIFKYYEEIEKKKKQEVYTQQVTAEGLLKKQEEQSFEDFSQESAEEDGEKVPEDWEQYVPEPEEDFSQWNSEKKSLEDDTPPFEM